LRIRTPNFTSYNVDMRKLRFVALLALIFLGCRAFQPGILEEGLLSTREVAPTAWETPTVQETAPVWRTPPDAAESLPGAQPGATPQVLGRQEVDFLVRTHPDGALYVGDRVSFEVIPPEGFEIPGKTAAVRVVAPIEQELGEVEFGRYGIGQRAQATLTWAWDTRALQPGRYELEFAILPQGPAWSQSVELLPTDALPQPEPQARWLQTRLDCCIVHYISGTEAERDLPLLLDILDEQSQRVSARLGSAGQEPVSVTLLPRVLGHGGFAGSGISLSYLDRLYTSSEVELVFHHELVHIYDARLGGDLRPTILVEGLAVYLTGGHFKSEPLLERAATLLPAQPGCVVCGLGWYIPLTELVDDFYTSQHEVGYLQAGALVEYLVETHGWEAYNAFYRDIRHHSSGSQALAMEAALTEHFGLTLAELDTQFQSALAQEALDAQWVADVRLTVQFYDAVRDYQLRFDPSAYFQTAWLPDENRMRELGITADFLRRPAQPQNIILENLLAAAGEALQNGQYLEAEQRLETVRYLLVNLPQVVQAN
jgi:hypothetical protein